MVAFGAALLSLAQLGCQPIATGNRLTVASAGKISSLDPAQASTVNTIQLLSALGDPLYSLDGNKELIPRLAEASPIVSPDGLTVTIPLRRDVLFHDGTRFDAEAMAFSLRRFLEIGTLSYVVGGRIRSVEVAADHQLVLRLSRPSTSLEGLLTSVNLTPVSPTAYAQYRDGFLHDRFVGTGPYRLTDFSEHQQRLEPFEQYWGEPPANPGLDLITLSNSTALYGALRSGEVDVLLSPSIDEDQRHALHETAQEGQLLEAIGPATEIGYITLLSNVAPLKDPRLRQALALSINRQEISERVSYGLRRPLRSLVPPSISGARSSSWPAHDPTAARALLNDAGFCAGQPLRIPLTFRSNVPADKLLALTWQAQVKRDLSDCLVLELDGVESTTIYRQLGEGAFKAVMLDWRGSYPDPEAYLTPLLSCSSPQGDVCLEGEASISGSFWSTKGLQETLTRSDRLRGAERNQELQRIETITAKGAAYIPVWLEAPRAWSQTNLEQPRFDGSGQLLLAQLRELP
ncbi:ABC transporter substrate-binding protein [Synechococcus sp. A15-24]|uniref:ABC transporter substrate-binding protein n=1 Tax=Synechococcus sp. A15-24 TaxID=1050635 RepID=UPI0025702F8D|nr:ABC transporter substrate-binding protein [Synechococcus sp. A15-24]